MIDKETMKKISRTKANPETIKIITAIELNHIPVQCAKTIMDMLKNSSLSQATRDACVVLVNDRVSVTNEDMLRTNMSGQTVMHGHNLYS